MAQAPRREVVLEVLSSADRPMHPREIATRLGLEEGEELALYELLDDLAYEGVLSLLGRRFRLAAAQKVIREVILTGAVNANPRGFAFVAGGATGDVYVPREALGGALHGDVVTVRVVAATRRGTEGEVTSIVSRRHPRIAGTLHYRGKSAWLEPDDARIRGPIVLRGVSGARDGGAAVATITRFPELPDENPEGELFAVLGDPGDPQAEIAKVLVREGVDEAHSPTAVAEAEAFGAEIDEAEAAKREDLTGIPLVTIDPEDARDHDDAVHVVRHDDGSFSVWIAIADVSHYVRPGTALDDEALARGNSVYLPDRAIPMLPRALSSNLCSLLPAVRRLCLACLVTLDAGANVSDVRVVEGVMRSAARLTYPGVANALGLSTEAAPEPEALARRDALQVMLDLARILRGRRLKRGALDLDLPEPKVLLDSDGTPLAVQKRTKDPGVGKAYHLVEELMLLANESVARLLVTRGAPAVFRCHAPPDPEKMDRFATLTSELGLAFDLEHAAEPKKLAAFLRKLVGHPRQSTLHLLLLRAMKQAYYDIDNVGHFGLASAAYLHFTSPIRRYADLVVHRIVRALVRGEPIDTSEPALGRLRLAAVTASTRERRAMDVEREVVDLYRALYMVSRVGMVLEGVVTGLVGSGVFVEIADPFIMVLVRLESLGPDSYELDDERLRVVGARSGERIAIGDAMLVSVEDVSLTRRTVYGRRLAPARREPADDKGRTVRSARRGETRAHEPKKRLVAKSRKTKPTKPIKKGGKKRR
jgi:ribonuclease R